MLVDSNEPKLMIAKETAAGNTVLVFGATGQQGGAVAAALRANGWPVRALVRDPSSEQAKALSRMGIDLVLGNFSDPASIQAAMSEVYGVFSVQPSSGQGAVYGVSDEQEVQYGKTIADIALSQGVKHLIYTSVGAAGKGLTGMGHFDSKTQIEEYIGRLNLRSTIIRPSTFMEMSMLPGLGLDQGKFTFFLRPDQTGQLIAVQDIGKIASSIFADPERFAGRTIEIAGDEVTGIDLQEKFSRAAGKSIVYQRFPDSLLDQNVFLGRLAALIDDGRAAGSADITALKQEFGDLMSLDEWLAGPGKPLLEKTIQAKNAPLALR